MITWKPQNSLRADVTLLFVLIAQRLEDGASYSALSMLHRIAKEAQCRFASRADLPFLIAAITCARSHPNTLESIDGCLRMNRLERQCNVDP